MKKRSRNKETQEEVRDESNQFDKGKLNTKNRDKVGTKQGYRNTNQEKIKYVRIVICFEHISRIGG